MKNNRVWQILLSLGLLVGLFFLFRNSGQIDFTTVLNQLKRFRILGLLAPLLFWMGVNGGGILRLYFVMPKEGRPSLFKIAYAVSWGQTMNLFLPARSGDALKVYLLSNNKADSPKIVASIIAERLVDYVAITLLVLSGGPFFWKQFKMPKIPLQYPLIGIGLIIFIFLILRKNKKSTLLHSFYTQFKNSFSAKPFLLALISSLIAWSCEIFAILLLSSQLGLTLPFSSGLFILIALNLAIAVPILPANLGSFEASMAYAIQLFGGNLSEGFAIGTTHHALCVISMLLWCALLSCFQKGSLWKKAIT